MSCVFQNSGPPPHSPLGECEPPAFVAGGGHTRWVERGVGGQYFGRHRHSSVLYICKYLVLYRLLSCSALSVSRESGEEDLGVRELLRRGYSAGSVSPTCIT
jgi:hypothetical protein